MYDDVLAFVKAVVVDGLQYGCEVSDLGLVGRPVLTGEAEVIL
jgi:hypothetical protein